MTTADNRQRVLDLLNTETAQRLRGLYVSNVADATGLSESTARVVLHRLRDEGLVRQSYHRSSRGYSFSAITAAERAQAEARQNAVQALEDALAALVPGGSFDVAGLINGGVSIRMGAEEATALAEALERDEVAPAF